MQWILMIMFVMLPFHFQIKTQQLCGSEGLLVYIEDDDGKGMVRFRKLRTRTMIDDTIHMPPSPTKKKK